MLDENQIVPSDNCDCSDENDSQVIESKDYFTCCEWGEYAGKHIIFDFFGAQSLDNIRLMEDAMREAVHQAGATLLHIHLHHFTENNGISGVAVLAESHISVHTWPERGYAAFDVFMCGYAQPEKTIPILQEAFKPLNVKVIKHLRGVCKG